MILLWRDAFLKKWDRYVPEYSSSAYLSAGVWLSFWSFHPQRGCCRSLDLPKGNREYPTAAACMRLEKFLTYPSGSKAKQLPLLITSVGLPWQWDYSYSSTWSQNSFHVLNIPESRGNNRKLNHSLIVSDPFCWTEHLLYFIYYTFTYPHILILRLNSFSVTKEHLEKHSATLLQNVFLVAIQMESKRLILDPDRRSFGFLNSIFLNKLLNLQK